MVKMRPAWMPGTAALSLLAACAAGAASTAHPETEAATEAEECRIIAEVARNYHKIDPAKPKQVKKSGAYLPDCPWESLGLRVTDAREAGNRWVTFRRPRIEDERAGIMTGIMHGRLSGHGAECTLSRKSGEWRLESCRRMWVS